MNMLQNRYGISALSKKFKLKSVPNEIMIDKTTGEIQIKSKEGNIYSYNAISRMNAHMDTMIFNSYNSDIYGKIYEITIDNLDMPCNISKEVNIMDSPISIDDNFKRCIISVDLDIITPSSNLSRLDISEVPIELEFSYENNTKTTQTMKIVSELYKINRTIISKVDLPTNFFNLRLTGIKIDSSELYTGFEEFILHSILMNIEV